jgi:hypothetical protein
MPKSLGTSAIVLLTAALMSSSALAHRAVDPLPQRIRNDNTNAPPYVAPPKVKSGKWAALKAGFPGSSFPDTPNVLTDGTVMMHDGCTSDWYRLTPDSKGSYVNGTWKKTASMPSNYKPLYFASQVLNDGRFIVNGGEYNSCQNVHTTLGALYDPVKDKWTAVNPPTGWTTIGDATSIVSPDGTYVLTNCCSLQYALASISGTDVTWTIETASETGKADNNNEEGWTYLPNNTVMTVDANRDLNGQNDVEILSLSTNKWSTVGKTPVEITDPGSHEVGPAPLLPSGFVFQTGGTTNNAVYDPVGNKWKTGPQFKSNDGKTVAGADGPGVVLPNGHALFQVSPITGCNQPPFCGPSHFFEVQVNGLTKVTAKQVDEPKSAANQASYQGRLLMLPDGTAFWTSDVGDIQIYAPKGHAKAAWLPTITSVPATLTRGSSNNTVQGTQFNGFSQGGYYGDDVQVDTNFPLVRITNTGSGKVCYARTHDFSSRGISTPGAPGSTQFDVPNTCDTGSSNVQVVVNGIASAPSAVTVN